LSEIFDASIWAPCADFVPFRFRSSSRCIVGRESKLEISFDPSSLFLLLSFSSLKLTRRSCFDLFPSALRKSPRSTRSSNPSPSSRRRRVWKSSNSPRTGPGRSRSHEVVIVASHLVSFFSLSSLLFSLTQHRSRTPIPYRTATGDTLALLHREKSMPLTNPRFLRRIPHIFRRESNLPRQPERQTEHQLLGCNSSDFLEVKVWGCGMRDGETEGFGGALRERREGRGRGREGGREGGKKGSQFFDLVMRNREK